MQPDHHWQAQTYKHFVQTSRQYFGLVQAPVAKRPPLRVAAPQQQIFRTLLLAGSLGSVLGIPAFASEATRIPEESTCHQSANTTRTKDQTALQAGSPVLAGRPR